MKKDIGFWDINGNYVEDIQEINKMDMDKYFEELNDMANFKNFGESKEEEITIDGVDVAQCGYFCESDNECSICGMGTDGEDTFCKNCKDNSNCYYKQLKRLEFELKVTKADYEASEQENAELKAENERLDQESQELFNDKLKLDDLVKELRQENERLKEELTENNCFEPNSLKCKHAFFIEDKLKQTLQEIKEFCKKEIEYFDNNDDYGQQADWIALLQIITKAEEE